MDMRHPIFVPILIQTENLKPYISECPECKKMFVLQGARRQGMSGVNNSIYEAVVVEGYYEPSFCPYCGYDTGHKSTT